MSFTFPACLRAIALAFGLSVAVTPLISQTTNQMNAARIPAHADLSARTRLSGHVPAWANAANDRGAMTDATELHLDFVLTRPAAVQAAFEQLLKDQQNPASPKYHHWLTPAAIGQSYGPAQADVDVLTGWLAGAGFRVDEVAPSRMFVRASATAAVAGTALGTSFHSYAVAGRGGVEVHTSAEAEPSIPTALTVLVRSIAGVAEAPDRPAVERKTGREGATGATAAAGPQYTSSSTGSHYITPGDFAILYDVQPAYNAGYNGSGQKVAILGRSRVDPADITNYEAAVGLGTGQVPNVVIPPLGADPGQAGGGDQGEATLDVQRVIGTAPGAQVDLVISSSAAGGLRTAIQYNVQTLLDPVMTISFGACEASAGLATVDLYTGLFSQAAAEGISVFVSAGDAGAAGCDTHGAAAPATAQVASINYICSSGFATCVGGTEFAEGSGTGYWNTTNTSSRVSALSYIPEGVWNEPTATTIPFVIDAGGGGVSTYTTKPDFQTGTGVPADGFRDTPDVSFSSSGHDGYFGCLASSGGSCTVTNGLFYYEYFYGTSAAAPSMAGIAALLNEKVGSAQGNLNPLLYRLAATKPAVFHDATIASSGVSGCTATVPSLCNNSTPSAASLTGGLAGYLLTTGYDLATGWGSLDVNQFLNTAASTGTGTSVTLTGTSGTVYNPPSLHYTATIGLAGTSSDVPTGTVQFYENGTAMGSAVTVANVGGTAQASTSASNPGIGTYLMTAVYSGDSNFDPANSAALSLTIAQPGTAGSKATLSATPMTITTAQTTTLTATVSPITGTTTPTGTVNFASSGGAVGLSSLATLANGTASVHIGFPAGTQTFVATYSGDATYEATNSAPVTVTSTLAPTTTALVGPATLTTASTAALTATVSGLPIFTNTGSVSFFDGTTLLGKTAVTLGNTLLSQGGTTGTASFTTTGGYVLGSSHSFTAVYSGDSNSMGSSSAAVVLTVTAPPGISVAAASPTLSFTAGAASGNTDSLTVTGLGAYSGTVTLSCAVSYNGSGSAGDVPACGLSNASVTVAQGGTATSTLTISTTTRSAQAVRAMGLGALVLGMPLLFVRRSRFRLLGALVMFAMIGGMVGCSSGGSSGGSTTPIGTTAGTYSVVVTASGGSGVTASTTISLTVN